MLDLLREPQNTAQPFQLDEVICAGPFESEFAVVLRLILPGTTDEYYLPLKGTLPWKEANAIRNAIKDGFLDSVLTEWPGYIAQFRTFAPVASILQTLSHRG